MPVRKGRCAVAGTVANRPGSGVFVERQTRREGGFMECREEGEMTGRDNDSTPGAEVPDAEVFSVGITLSAT